MWLNWLPGRASTNPRPHQSRTFCCSSFKHIEELCSQGPEPETPPYSPGSPNVFHRVSALRCHFDFSHSPPPPPPTPPPTVVVYFTSLRVVRKTFEDCRAVRSILRGLRVPIDERDLSMDATLVRELKAMTGRWRLSIPCVFIGERLIGGPEEVKRLHESGELLALVGRGSGGGSVSALVGACDQCIGLRYVVCKQCDGSRRIYSKGLSGFRACTVCNVNGLIRCPSCSLSVVPDPPYLGLDSDRRQSTTR